MNRRLLTLAPGALAIVLTVATRALPAAPAAPDVDVKIDVAVPSSPVAPGASSEAVLKLTAPQGVHLNRYPGIKLTLDPNPELVFPDKTVKVGLDAMPDDPDQNAWDMIDPIHVRFQVGEKAQAGKIPVKAQIKFYYCVAKSGYCAPGKKDVAFNVPVAGTR